MQQTSPFRYTPSVSLTQMLVFDPNPPETHTGVRVIDLMLSAFYHLGETPHLATIASAMGLTVRTLREVVRMETGISFLQFIEARDMMKLCVYHRTHPKPSTSEIVQLMDYAGESSYWRFRRGPRYKRNLARHNQMLQSDPLYRQLFDQKCAAGLEHLAKINLARKEIDRLEQEIKRLS